jgi:hypothetical protein
MSSLSRQGGALSARDTRQDGEATAERLPIRFSLVFGGCARRLSIYLAAAALL